MDTIHPFPAARQPPSRHSAAKLLRLNDEYVEAFLGSDVDWFRRHLAEDFRCILADGSIIDREAFLADAAEPVAMASFEVEDASVQFEGDVAIVQARTVQAYRDGRRARTRYTDIWVGRDGRWQALCAQITEIAAA